MIAGLESRPVATMYDVEALVKLAWSGQIRVPHFQRDFRWQRHDVSRLFESILRGYPVGSLLLWRRPSPEQQLTLGRLLVDGPATDRALYVVDGQQRIVSLANALHPDTVNDPVFGLAYDLNSGKFVDNPTVEDPTIIPLSVLFDLTKVLGWFGKYPAEAQQYVTEANEITQTLRQFQIPAYEVVQDDVKVLQDIFDRMNNYGKRLSRAEIFSALYAEDESVTGQLSFATIAAQLDEELGFGVVDDDTVMTAILARRGPDVRREIRNEFGTENFERRGHTANQAIIEFPDEDQETAYRLGHEAMRRAIMFLQDHAGVPHISLLPYRHLLVVLTRVFAHHPQPDDRNLILLRRWFWRAAVTGPEIFKGGTPGTTRFLNSAVKPHDLTGSVQELLRLVDRPDVALPDLRRFRSNEAATKIILCSWWDTEPRSFDDGEPVERESLSACLTDRLTALDAVRYIMPRTGVPVKYRVWSANRILLPLVEDDTKSIESLLFSHSMRLEKDTWESVLASHHITEAAVGLLAGGQTVEFLMERQRTLEEQLLTFLSRMCEWQFENTPPLRELEIEDPDEVDDEPA